MSIRKIALVAALGGSLASGQVMAQTASLPSSQPARAGATLNDANAQDDDWGPSTEAYIVAFFALIAIGLGLYFAFIDDDEAPPVSP